MKQVTWFDILPVSETSIEELQGAWVRTSESGGQSVDTTMYRVELITDQGDIPLAGNDVLVTGFATDDRQREVEEAERINAFVTEGEGTLEIRREWRMHSLVAGIAAFILGLGVLTGKIRRKQGHAN